MKCIFSVDVEDWFHILDLPSTPDLAKWDSLPSRVEKNFSRLMEISGEQGVRMTCFFLGWVAQKYPHLLRLAQSCGHEIASHGFSHRLVYKMSPGEFLQDALRSKRRIEDIAGCEVAGYRASGFSVNRDTPWFFETLAAAGYQYDSSIFPAGRGHGGLPGSDHAPYAVLTGAGEVVEFPITVTKILTAPVCLFGGGYLRLAPWPLIKRGATQVLSEGRPVIFYVHPREIDPEQPRLPMSYFRQFKSYINLGTTEKKVKYILSEFEFATFGELLPKYQAQVAVGETTR